MINKDILKKGDKIEFEWLDAFGDSGWRSQAHIDESLKNHIICKAIGYYVKKDKQFLVICMAMHEDELSMPYLKAEYVPLSVIQNIKKLK